MATVVFAGQLAFNDGDGTGSEECTAAIAAIKSIEAATIIVSDRSSDKSYFSDRNASRVPEATCRTIGGAEAQKLAKYEEIDTLVASPSDDGSSLILGPLTFEHGHMVLVTAGTHTERQELGKKLAAIAPTVIFVPAHPSRDEFMLGILQSFLAYCTETRSALDGEIFVFALGRTTSYAFWAANLTEAHGAWLRAANDVGTYCTPGRSRLFVRHKPSSGEDAGLRFGEMFAHDIKTVRCTPWESETESGLGV